MIIIIGILAAIAIPMYINQRERAKDAAVKSGVHTIEIGIASYASITATCIRWSAEVDVGLLGGPTGDVLRRPWPDNPLTGAPMAQSTDEGDYTYERTGVARGQQLPHHRAPVRRRIVHPAQLTPRRGGQDNRLRRRESSVHMPDPRETRTVLDLAGVHKTVHVGFRRRPLEILKGVDLSVEEGEVFGLLGPNGAGKTTTVKVALGLMRRHLRLRRARGRRAGQGRLPAGEPVLLRLPLRARVPELLLAPLRARFRGADARVDELLKDVGLEAAADTHLRKYSKGMLQRIGIAQALVNDPELLLLDEPMTGLDPIGRVEVKRIIERLHDRGKTVLFNSHILSDVHELCSHIAIMREGRVAWRGEVAEALDEAATLEDFFIKVVTA